MQKCPLCTSVDSSNVSGVQRAVTQQRRKHEVGSGWTGTGSQGTMAVALNQIPYVIVLGGISNKYKWTSLLDLENTPRVTCRKSGVAGAEITKVAGTRVHKVTVTGRLRKTWLDTQSWRECDGL